MKKLLALLMFCASLSDAHTLSLNIGTAIPLTNLDITGGGSEKIGTAGFLIGGQYLYNLDDAIGFGVEINHFASGDKNSSTLIPALDSTISSQSTDLLAIVKYSFLPKEKVSPYLLAGLGAAINNIKMDAKPAAGFVWADTGTGETRNLGDSTKTSGASAIGAGLDFPLNDHVIIGGEVRYTARWKTTYDASTAAQAAGVAGIEGPLNTVGLMAKVAYKF